MDLLLVTRALPHDLTWPPPHTQVMPPLSKAIKGLRSIDKQSIAELKVMMNPPPGVKMVMRCICIMLDRYSCGNDHKSHRCVCYHLNGVNKTTFC